MNDITIYIYMGAVIQPPLDREPPDQGRWMTKTPRNETLRVLKTPQCFIAGT